MARGERMKRLTDAERDEAEKHIPLVKFLVGKLNKDSDKMHLDCDDQIQEGMIGVMYSLKSYDPDISKFSTYARTPICNFIMAANIDDKLIRIPQYQHYENSRGELYKEYAKAASKVHRVDPVELGNHSAVARTDVYIEETQDAKEQVDDAMKILSSEDRYIIESLYFQGVTQRELGKRLKLSPSTIRTRRGQALQKMREHMLAAV